MRMIKKLEEKYLKYIQSEKLNKIFFKKVELSPYNGERNFYYKTRIFFDKDLYIKIDSQEPIELKKYNSILISKSKVSYIYEGDKPNIYTYRIRNILIIHFLKTKTKNILLKFLFIISFITFLTTVNSFFNSVNYETIISIITAMSSIISGLIIIKIWFINFIAKKNFKKIFKNKTEIKFFTKYKNDIAINYEFKGKIKIKFNQIYFDFGRSCSKVTDIKIHKNINKVEYNYIQSFNKKNREPDEFYKYGNGEYYFDKNIGKFETTDKFTITKGGFEIINFK